MGDPTGGRLCLCDQEFDLDKPCMICRPDQPASDYAKSRSTGGLSDDDVCLPGEIACLADHMAGEIPNTVYGEVMEAAEMLNDLEIKDSAKLANLLGAHHNGKKWVFSTCLPDLDSISAEDSDAHPYGNTRAYDDLVYEGRDLCGAEPDKGIIDPGYCGIPSREFHDAQLRDSSCWVHASVERWFERAIEFHQGTPPVGKWIAPRGLVPSDRKLAVAATKRKNKDVSE